jgi:hypothetical protein
MKRKGIVSLLVFCCLFAACIKQVEPPLRSVEKILVVDGGITTDTGFYKVRLSYSGAFRFGNFVPDSLIEEQATVILKDDAGNETNMIYTSGGVYESVDADFIGVVGRAYSVEISLPGGKKYISDPEQMPEAVYSNDISQVQFDFFHYNFKNPSQFKIYANIQDPAAAENYYLWKSSGFIPRKATGVGCGFGCIRGEYCQQTTIDTALRFFSDQTINGNMIKDQLIGTAPVYWYGKYYLDFQQYSITRSAFQFLRQLQEQSSKTGSILDPLPSSIIGNVYNASDPTDRALGYFSASSVYHHRVVLLPLSLSQFILDQTAARFIPVGECTLTLPNTTENMDPPGFENAERIKFSW